MMQAASHDQLPASHEGKCCVVLPVTLWLSMKKNCIPVTVNPRKEMQIEFSFFVCICVLLFFLLRKSCVCGER